MALSQAERVGIIRGRFDEICDIAERGRRVMNDSSSTINLDVCDCANIAADIVAQVGQIRNELLALLAIDNRASADPARGTVAPVAAGPSAGERETK